MMEPLLEVGYKNYVFPGKATVILNPDSQPTKRMIQNAKEKNRVFDLRKGKKTNAVIVLTTGELVLSAITSQTIRNRYMKYVNQLNQIIEKEKEIDVGEFNDVDNID